MFHTSAFVMGSALALVGSGLIVTAPAFAAGCDKYVVSADPGLVSSAEVDQLREGMTLDQVQALFESPGGVQTTSEYTYSASTEIRWFGNISFEHWFGMTTVPEIDVSFSMDKATTKTEYRRKKVKVKNVKRAKRLGLPRWKWKTVKVAVPVPATPWTVSSFSIDGAEVLRQQRVISCSTY